MTVGKNLSCIATVPAKRFIFISLYAAIIIGTIPDARADENFVPRLQALGLPQIETLTAESDYTVFMRPEVPDDIRTLALRRLWFSDPRYRLLDGLDNYAEDLSDAGRGQSTKGQIAKIK